MILHTKSVHSAGQSLILQQKKNIVQKTTTTCIQDENGCYFYFSFCTSV